MMIRSAKSEELDVLMPIFEGAKAFMREAGNANQCLNGEECSDKKKTQRVEKVFRPAVQVFRTCKKF